MFIAHDFYDVKMYKIIDIEIIMKNDINKRIFQFCFSQVVSSSSSIVSLLFFFFFLRPCIIVCRYSAFSCIKLNMPGLETKYRMQDYLFSYLLCSLFGISFIFPFLKWTCNNAIFSFIRAHTNLLLLSQYSGTFSITWYLGCLRTPELLLDTTTTAPDGYFTLALVSRRTCPGMALLRTTMTTWQL